MLINFSRMCNLTVSLALLNGCSSFNPQPQATDSFLERRIVYRSPTTTYFGTRGENACSGLIKVSIESKLL